MVDDVKMAMCCDGCVACRCVGVPVESWISLPCSGLSVGTKLRSRQTCSVSCSHAPPCQMVLAVGMPASRFKELAVTRSKATEQKETPLDKDDRTASVVPQWSLSNRTPAFGSFAPGTYGAYSITLQFYCN
ncbi:hypothetical protein AMECASPLE_015012 [Ameca splendens]|uniref:Uncharacterized protein n=1 Tax=Ameca splendens TaxID=208324 RepID=A0ABV0YDP6_9TELE